MSFINNIRYFINPSSRYTDQYPSLKDAVRRHAPIEVFESLLSRQNDSRYSVNGGDYLFQLALQLGLDPKIPKLFIEKGYNLWWYDQAAENALHCATKFRNIELIKLILQKEPDLVNSEVEKEPYVTALHIAAERGHLEAIKTLISFGAQVEVGSPLNVAVLNGHLECVEELIASGADINNNRDRPLNSAIITNNCKMTSFLLHKGALPNHGDFSATDAIFTTSFKLEILEILVRLGVDLNPDKSSGVGILHQIVLAKNQNLNGLNEMEAKALIMLLIRQCNIDPELGNGRGQGTALCLAARMGELEITDALIESGARIDAKDRDGFNPFLLSLAGGNENCIKLLGEKTAQLSGYVLERFVDRMRQSRKIKEIDELLPDIREKYEIVWQDPADVLPPEIFQIILAEVGDKTEVYNVSKKWRSAFYKIGFVKLAPDLGRYPKLKNTLALYIQDERPDLANKPYKVQMESYLSSARARFERILNVPQELEDFLIEISKH